MFANKEKFINQSKLILNLVTGSVYLVALHMYHNTWNKIQLQCVLSWIYFRSELFLFSRILHFDV